MNWKILKLKLKKRPWPFDAQVNLCTERSPTECDDTRRCIIQFDLLMVSTTVLETCRGI